jgi:hypothetical protein
MQNREELRQKGHNGSKKNSMSREGEKYHFQKGGGINVFFGPKYKPPAIFCPSVYFFSNKGSQNVTYS